MGNRIEGLISNSLDWYAHRAKYRNASNAPAVMNESPYAKPYDVLNPKPWKGNIATDYGTNWESTALAKVSEILGVDFKPEVYVEGEYSASLDGYGEANGQTYKVEIKCPFQRTNSKLWNTAKSAEASGAMADKSTGIYYWQLVQQNMCAPTDNSFFFVYVPAIGDEREEWVLINARVNQGDDVILKAAWDDLYANPPEAPVTADESQSFFAMLSDHKELTRRKKELDVLLKASSGKIEEYAAGRSLEGHGSKVSQVIRKGNVQYKDVPALNGVDLEPYRGKETTYIKITHGKT
jgi:putative phage-type endonuclease